MGRLKAQGKHYLLPLEHRERQPLPVLIPWITGFPEGLQRGHLLPLPSHPALEAVQRQDSGGTRKREGLFKLGEVGGTGLQKAPLGRWKSTLSPGKAFPTRSALEVRNKGVFLGPVLGWAVT